ncbi:zinc-dependent metalloprotease [Austwickia chelonae]|uniref:zinc-dependent metalloprotease n=1 Tax=Austwickia chelonae TaxID=100225 RepID=UPI001FDFDF40|nr:zinc-dependent metalloprotease [Austwickia chelonae]
MSDTPRRPGGDDQPDFAQLFQQFLGDPNNPAMSEAMRSMGMDQSNPAMMGALAAQLRSFFEAAPTDGINTQLCSDTARQTATADGDPAVGDIERREVVEAVRIAELWLSQATTLDSPGAPAQAWSRSEWVSRTLDLWIKIVSPVAQGVNAAVVTATRGQLEQFSGENPPAIPGMPPGLDLNAMIAQFEPMLTRMSSSMFGVQTGQAIGTLATDVVSATEVGLPLLSTPTVALIPANVTALAEGLEVDIAQVRLYLALRESARTRLFSGVPWLGSQLLAAVEAYARDITIDTEGIERKLAEIDPRDPQAMQQALSKTLFSPEPSDAQKAALTRLETLLALTEGWVDVVTGKACEGRLPQAAALSESIRRRRATGGPAEAIFGELVGLHLRPRRLRDAANLFSALENAGGQSVRDSVWAHPDVAPTAADLDDILGFVERTCGDGHSEGDDGLGGLGGEIDAALAQILGTADTEKSPDPEGKTPPGSHPNREGNPRKDDPPSPGESRDGGNTPPLA